jgi:hypothetical protein
MKAVPTAGGQATRIGYKVSILEGEPRCRIDRLDDAVTDFVEQYRVPCMQAANGAVILLQEYNFDGDGRSWVMASPTRDSADPQRAAQLSCIQHLVPNSKPTYPRSSLRKGEEGTLIAKMHFTAADQPPGIEWVAPPPHRDLRIAVERYTAGFRMPCLRNGPVDAMRVYQFVINGGARTVLRDSTLIEFLATAKDLRTPAFFDLNTMSCPFDVRLSYYRPYTKNGIQQLDTLAPERASFLRWLAEVTLDFNPAQSLKVFGNSMIITVPCGKLDL